MKSIVIDKIKTQQANDPYADIPSSNRHNSWGVYDLDLWKMDEITHRLVPYTWQEVADYHRAKDLAAAADLQQQQLKLEETQQMIIKAKTAQAPATLAATKQILNNISFETVFDNTGKYEQISLDMVKYGVDWENTLVNRVGYGIDWYADFKQRIVKYMLAMAVVAVAIPVIGAVL